MDIETCGGLGFGALGIFASIYYGVRAGKLEIALERVASIQGKQLEMQDELFKLRHTVKNTSKSIQEKNTIIQEKEAQIKQLEKSISSLDKLRDVVLTESGFVPAQKPGPILGAWFIGKRKSISPAIIRAAFNIDDLGAKKVKQLENRRWEEFLDYFINNAQSS